jgi:imidazolonepropionase-like amidohydrolase
VTNKSIPVISAAAVTPGLIDAYSVVPLAGEYNIPADQDQDETSDPNQADTRVIDGFNPAEPLMRYLLEQGITVIHACPGRANAISGLTGVFRTHGRTAEKMTVRFPQAMLFNLGTSPKQTYKGRRPNSRMGTASLIREALNAAANYLRKQESRKAGEPEFDRNLKHEAMKLVLQRKIPAMFCAHRADDILTALRISREFNCDPVIALATEGYLITEELAKSNVPIVVHPTMQRVAGIETYHTYLGNAAALADAKIRIAIGSGVEGYVPKTRVIRFEAALAMVYGLGFDRALKSVTLDAARILKIDNQFGSIEVGKTADLVLFDGDPFEHATHVTHVLVDGRLVHRRQDRRDIPLAQRLFFFSPEIPCCLW